MTFDRLSAFYTANQALIAGLGVVAGVAVLLVAANRLRAMKEHRATLLVANVLTVLAAALATMVSASGMWKFFTDILGQTPLRIAFFAFIEIALFACALLARSRLLREPHKGSTGVDGIAVWVLAALTATLSAMDSDSFREVCLRLVAPLVAAWMWERALAAERNVRLGTSARRINWTLTPQRIFVWLRLAEPHDRDVSEVDRARRRAKLGRARLHLHLLQTRNASARRVRRTHRNVVKQAMQAAEHIGLADLPNATNEREAIQMYMATLYGFVDGTSPQAVAHLNAWQTAPRRQHINARHRQTGVVVPAGVLNSTDHNEDSIAAITANGVNGVNGAKVLTGPLSGQAAPDDASHAATQHSQAGQANGRRTLTGRATPQFINAKAGNDPESGDRRHNLDLNASEQPQDFDSLVPQAAGPARAQRDSTDQLESDGLTGARVTNDDRPADEADHTAVAAMRRFWDHEIANGRIPTGAQLSRAAGVPPTTGLGRRKRREWQTELPNTSRPPLARADER